MCGCGKVGFNGSVAPCGCQSHAAAFDGSGQNNGGDTLTPEFAMMEVERILIQPDELVGLTPEEVTALKADRYAKMRYYFDANKLALTQANIYNYSKLSEPAAATPMLLARHPFLKTAGFLALLLVLTLGGLYFLTRGE